MIHFFLACEDPLSESFCLQLMKTYFPSSTYNPIMVTGGIGELKKKVEAFINIAKIQDKATLILTDLDQVGSVESLIADWQGAAIFPDAFFLLIAVKEIESWVLADCDAFSQWSGIPKNKIPINPDDENDVKQTLLNLVKRHGNIQIKRDLLPNKDAKTSKVGIAYNSSLINFVNNYWRIEKAKLNSLSLSNVDLALTQYANRK
ncbi:MAG: DUF4276 family protein [Acinetobacter johnsonii]|jgi:hypothetical protein|uniref:DUF4276 family protein n=1 Tax=Acinetobacter johnsonii TaxID=40214 RepID=UPI002D7FFF0A|nr:hypothetical protein [Acinetobacter johnsonii]